MSRPRAALVLLLLAGISLWLVARERRRHAEMATLRLVDAGHSEHGRGNVASDEEALAAENEELRREAEELAQLVAELRTALEVARDSARDR